MKVKIRGKIYHGDKEPIMIYLSAGDAKNIVNMDKDCCVYCEYPDSVPINEIKEITQEFRREVEVYNTLFPPIGKMIIGKPQEIRAKPMDVLL